jgi:ATP-dependent DNA helicase RecG
VAQRLQLAQKAGSPHIAVMSATPIPRTLGLVLYGDMDISVLDELPPGREKVDTFYVTGAYRGRMLTFLEKQVNEGRQIYIICPMIEENEKQNAASVNRYAEETAAALPNCAVRTLHGRMKPAEKQAVMDDFAAGRVDILVSTTVVEVGVNVPNATVMVVENAERFGLAQLHQLRGRVGRGSAKSYCVLVTDSDNELTLRRMKAMRETSDGFKISELDLKLRGSGDFFGTRQHGLPEFKLANLYRDMDMLEDARAAAMECVDGEGFCDGELEAVYKEAERFFVGDGREVAL